MYGSASTWQSSYQQMPPPPFLPSSQLFGQSHQTHSATPGFNTSSPISSPVLHSYDQMSLTPAGASFNPVPPSYPQTYDQPSYLSETTHTPSPVGAASNMNVGVAAVPSPTDSAPIGPGQNVTPPTPVVPRDPYLAVGRSNTRYLPSSAIRKDQLRDINEVVAQHRNLVHKDTAGTLCQILAREAVFGKDVLARCTITGNGGKTALPLQELNNLKIKMFSLFPAYHNSPSSLNPFGRFV